MQRIEALLSARLFLQPQLVGNDIFFISDLSGRLSLYAMHFGGSLPRPLLPPHLALQNPHLVEPHYSFAVFPKHKQILVMLDRDGDEIYRPHRIPIKGAFPEPAFGEQLDGFRVYLNNFDSENGIVYLEAHELQQARVVNFRGDLESGELVELYSSKWGASARGASPEHDQVLLIEEHTTGDSLLLRWMAQTGKVEVLYGRPIETRTEGKEIPTFSWFRNAFFHGSGVLLDTALFDDRSSCGYLELGGSHGSGATLEPVETIGTIHQGQGELAKLDHLEKDRYLLHYNINGVSWIYEARFLPASRRLEVISVLTGQEKLADGVVESCHYDPVSDSLVLSFSSATSPTQIYTVETDRVTQTAHTRESLLGLDETLLSSGEDASFASFDGLHIPARLYLPAEKLGFSGPRPLVYYVHGGPQSQERPDFSWFSMPLIQFLALNGFAVFVPNARGSSGYGLEFTKHVDRDWGGNDRLDHVHAMTQILPLDERLDVHRAAVVGRSYGGYMALTLATRHSELWAAAVDMFGPYDLLTFLERIPATWKPYFEAALGDPEKDRPFLIERSPRTFIDNLTCPLLVIQGVHDPRVVERESQDLVEHLQSSGKVVEYLVFPDEGHDMLKFPNKVRAYNAIKEFIMRFINPGLPKPPPDKSEAEETIA